jgi:outer membrane protein OmpA-like peptidoglycan-associated protein
MSKPPETKKLKPPLYYVTMCDMFNLLLAFYICMVAMADTRMGALVGAGHGPFVRDVISKSKPGIGTGTPANPAKTYPRDGWWIPDQQGDPDQLERVTQRLDKELPTRFRPGEVSVSYHQDTAVLRLPARIEYDANGNPRLSAAVMATLRLVAEVVRRKPGRSLRVNGDVPASGSLGADLYESARQGQMAFYWLNRLGVEPNRISLWGWGAGRISLAANPADPANRGLTLEIYDQPTHKPADTGERN